MSQCASSKNKGIFNGFAWVIFNISMILGNLLGGILLSHVKYSTFYTVIPCITIVGVFYFLGVRQPDPVEEEEVSEIFSEST